MYFHARKTISISLLLFALACREPPQDNDANPDTNQTIEDAGADAVSQSDTDSQLDAETDSDHDATSDSGPDTDPPTESEDLLFFDDFSSGDMANSNEYFRWGQGSPPAPGSGSGRVEVVEGPNGDDVHARRFRYIGVDDGGEGDGLHFSEQRFALTESLEEERSRNDASDTAYPEVWISYWMLVPENYHHNLKGGTISGSNQKGWLYLWKDRYEKWIDSVDGEIVTPTSASLHWWPITENEESENYAMTRTSLVPTRGRSGWGHSFNPDFALDDLRVADGDNTFTFLESEYGTWVHYIFGVKVASEEGAGDGFVRIYKNGELAVAWEDSNHGSDDADSNGFDRGYLMGYHNAAYTKTTTYYLTDFRFGLTQEAVTAE